MGSGKTTACKVFESLGVPVFYADQQAHQVYERAAVRKALIQRFGNDIYMNDNQLNKPLLSQLIFNDKQHLQFVNGIIHPEVRNMYAQWKASKGNLAYTLYEAAILFETGIQNLFHEIIFVSAPEDIRIQRVMQRNQLTEAQVRQRMQNQWAESEKILHCTYIIYNDQQQLLIPQVLEIHRKLMRDASVNCEL